MDSEIFIQQAQLYAYGSSCRHSGSMLTSYVLGAAEQHKTELNLHIQNNAVAIGLVTGRPFPWLLVRQSVMWSSTNQIHAIFMHSTMRFVPYLQSSRIAVSSAQSDIFSPVGSILAALHSQLIVLRMQQGVGNIRNYI